MIPQRMFVSAPFENELRERISACRKRLRESRVAQRAQATAELTNGGESFALIEDKDLTKRLHCLELEEVGIT